VISEFTTKYRIIVRIIVRGALRRLENAIPYNNNVQHGNESSAAIEFSNE
jgi:hypothetical protein